MWHRFKVEDGDEVSFTEWTEAKHALDAGAQRERIDAVTKLRAANPDAAISMEKSQTKPDTSKS